MQKSGVLNRPALLVLAMWIASGCAVEAAETVQYSYDAQGRLSTVTNADNTTHTYLYENTAFPNAMTGLIDESAQRFSSWSYDTQGRAVNTVESGGAGNTSLVYNADGSVTVTDPLGAVRTFTFGRYGDRNLVTGISGSQCPTCSEGLATTYDLGGFVSSRTDYNGNVTHYVYDDTRGLETSRTEAYGTPAARTITTQWHATYRLPTLITEPGRTTSFTYDASGNQLTKTVTDTATTLSRTWTYTYNSYGQVLTVDGPRTDVSDLTTFTYYTCNTGAQCGQLHTATDAAGNQTTYLTYNADGQPLTLSDPNGVITTLTYDARQRLTSRSVGTELTSFSYYPTGLLQQVTLPDNSYLQYTYDAAHRLTQIADSAGNSLHYTLDAAGNRTAENLYDPTNTLAQTRSRVFDTLGHLSQEIGAATQTTHYSYDNNGNVLSITDPATRQTQYSYDALNRLSQVIDPAAHATHYGYDAHDNLTTVTDPRTLTTSYSYNGLGDQTQLQSPDTGITHLTYDAAGNLAHSTDARTRSGAFSYDAIGRVAQIGYADQTLQFTYDQGVNGKGHLTQVSDGSGSTQWTYSALGRPLTKQQVVSSTTLTVGYGYNSAGQLSTLITPSGQLITYSYTNNCITSISVNNSPLLTQVTYAPFGGTTGWSWSNATNTIRQYDTDGQLSAVSSGGISTYTFNPDGTIASRTDSSSGPSSVPSGATTLAVNGSSNQITSTTGTLTRTYSYDAAGNTLSDGSKSFTYNDAGRMTSATSSGLTTTYLYNALGQRVKKSNPTGATYFVYDEAGHLAGEYDQSGAMIQELVWLNDIPVATIRTDQGGTGAGVFYIHTDHLNAPSKITRPSDNVAIWRWDHDPYGNGTPNQDPDGNGLALNFNLRYPGQYFDQETGLLQNYYREYDPAVGRYLQSDPIGLAGGQFSTYAYVGNNPISNIDPFGLDAHHIFPRANWPNYSSDAKNVFDESTVGTAGRHGWSTAHKNYNQATKDFARNYCESKGIDPSKMTEPQARDLVDEITKSSDPRIKDFLAREIGPPAPETEPNVPFLTTSPYLLGIWTMFHSEPAY
jgi:RHS repeat-associated protein